MRIDFIECLLSYGNEITFTYKNKNYLFKTCDDSTQNVILTCDEDKDFAITQKTFEFRKSKIGDKTIEEIVNELPDSSFHAVGELEDFNIKHEAIMHWLEQGDEIEFEYRNDIYWITHWCDNEEDWGEFYKANEEPIMALKSIDELLRIKIDGKTLDELFAELPCSAYDIY